MFPAIQNLPPGNFDFESLGHAAATYQHSPQELWKAAHELGIEPVFMLDGIAYFLGDDLARSARWLNREEPSVAGETNEEGR